jgi:polar amino acid transport system substrate-binding protein
VGGVAGWIVLSLLLGSGGAWAAEHAEDKLVRIGTGEWTPYVESQRADAGPLGRLIRAAFAEAGYRVRFYFYPWERDVHLLQKGELDGIMPYICTAERQHFSLCAAPLVRGQTVLFHRRDTAFDWRSLSDLERYRIAITQGYSYGAEFDQARAEGRFQLSQDSREDRGMRLLLAGRVDLHPQDLAVGYNMLRQGFSEAERAQLTHHPRALSQHQLTVLLRKDERGERLRQAFDQALARMREAGDPQALQQALDEGRAAKWQPSE